MEKRLLKNDETLIKLLDDIYNIYPDDMANKAHYIDRSEQLDYILSKNKLPTEYPCVIIYDLIYDNHSNYQRPDLNNRKYVRIGNCIYVTLNDFKK